MLSRCAGCGREYDLSSYPGGYTGTCLCGQAVVRVPEPGDTAGQVPLPVPANTLPAQVATGATSPEAKTSGLAIASMVVGIVSLPLFMLWIPLGPVALGLGIAALISTSQRPDRTGGGMAVAGIVTAAVSLLLFVGVVFGAMFAAAEAVEQFGPLGTTDPPAFDLPFEDLPGQDPPPRSPPPTAEAWPAH